MINLIDTHFHLDFYKDHKEIYKKINELKQYTICVTNSPEVYEECQRIYFNTKYVISTNQEDIKNGELLLVDLYTNDRKKVQENDLIQHLDMNF